MQSKVAQNIFLISKLISNGVNLALKQIHGIRGGGCAVVKPVRLFRNFWKQGRNQ